MAGRLEKDRIIDQKSIQDALKAIAESAMPIIKAFDDIAASGRNIATSVGGIQNLKDIVAMSKLAAQNQKNLADQQKQMAAASMAASRAQTAASRANIASIQQQTAASKAAQQQLAAEAQVRQRNAQAMAAEERARQTSIRTRRLEQSENTKSTSSFTRLAYSLRTYIAAYASLQSLMSVVSSIFKQTKELDSLSFSMKTIIKDTNELAQTQVFLAETAKNYGLNLLTISERYARFRAATIQSNMAAKETQKIFDSVSRASSVLGLRTDEVSGVYLALEQMISKGKVTTEELRRQLGERLSGAFGIFAAAIGVSTSELDKMLKKGQILSAEVLPKFADQLLKAYGIENVKRVDNLAAAQGRLNTAWTEFIASLDASAAFAGMFNTLADSIARVNNAIKPDKNKTTERSVKLISQSVDKLSEAATVQERQEILTREILALEEKRGKISAQLLKDDSKRPGLLDKTVSKLNQTLGLGGEFTSSIMFEQVYQDTVLDEKAYKLAIDNLKKNFSKLVVPPIKNPNTDGDTEGSGSGNLYTELEKMQDAHKRELEILKANQEELLDEFEGLESERLDIVKTNNIAILNERRNQILEEMKLANPEQRGDLSTELAGVGADIASTETKGNRAINKQLLKEELSDQRAFEDSVAQTTRELEEYKRWLSDTTLNETQENIDLEQLALQEAAMEKIKLAQGNKDEIMKIQHELTQAMLNEEKLRLQAAIDSGNLDINDKERTSRRIRQIDLAMGEDELAYAERKEQDKVEIRQQTMQGVNDVLQQGLQFSQMIYSAQADRARAAYESELEAAGDSLEGQIIAKRKFEAEDKKIRKKQAIAAKLSAILDAGLALAMAIATTWKNPLLAALNIAAASLGLGMAVATPLPAFFKGTDNAPSEFIAGEKGSELITLQSGEQLLTPNKATHYKGNEFIGAKITPHDDTLRYLANYAVNQNYDMIDLSSTNGHLATIAKNTKGGTDQSFINPKGQKVTKRGITQTTYI